MGAAAPGACEGLGIVVVGCVNGDAAGGVGG